MSMGGASSAAGFTSGFSASAAGGRTWNRIVLGSICVFAQEKSTWLTPLTSGTIRSSSTSVALGLSRWISTRWRTGSVISLMRARAALGMIQTRKADEAINNVIQCLRMAELLGPVPKGETGRSGGGKEPMGAG